VDRRDVISRRDGSGATRVAREAPRRPAHRWCAADHRYNLSEHRSDEIAIEQPGHGRAVLTGIRDARGRE
jgi:hypothetical protein